MNIVTLHLINTIITFVGWILFCIWCNSDSFTSHTEILWLLLTSTIMASALDAMVMGIYERYQVCKTKEERERMNPDILYAYLRDKPVIDAGYDKNRRCHITFKITSATKTFIGGTRIEWKMNESISGGIKLKGTAQLIKNKEGGLFVINYCDKHGNGYGIPNKVIETISSDLDMPTKYDINNPDTYDKYCNWIG